MRRKCFSLLLSCRPRFVTIYIINLLIVIIILRSKISIIDLRNFSQVEKCPACYGRSLCSEFYSGEIEIADWTKWQLLHFFNQKNVFWANYKSKKVVLKKLGHNSELNALDQRLCEMAFSFYHCDVSKAARKLAQDFNYKNIRGNTDLLHCPSHRLFLEIEKSFKKIDDIVNTKAYLITLLLLNPEPLILQTFSSEDGWPFPHYLGACGRIIMESYIGEPLTYFENASWKARLKYAIQLTQIAQNLTNTSLGFHLYLTDVTFDNFAVSSDDKVILVDTENILIVDYSRINNDDHYESGHFKDSENHLIFSAKDLCSNKFSDHNYYVICQGLLAQNPWSNGMVGGLLHDIPEAVEKKWHLKSLIAECVKPRKRFGRFKVFSILQNALHNALLDYTE